jgi:hypothetical protein
MKLETTHTHTEHNEDLLTITTLQIGFQSFGNSNYIFVTLKMKKKSINERYELSIAIRNSYSKSIIAYRNVRKNACMTCKLFSKDK